MSFLGKAGYQGESPDQVEARMAAGGMLPPGKYYATLTGAKEIESKSKGTPGDELTFTVSRGPLVGMTLTDTLWASDHQRSKDRLMLFGSRLGTIRRTPDGKAWEDVPGKESFLDCLDTEVIIEVQHEKFKRDDGSEGVSARLTFGGIFDVSDRKAASEVGKPPAAKGDQGGGAAGGAAAKTGGKPSGGGGAAGATPAGAGAAGGAAAKRNARAL